MLSAQGSPGERCQKKGNQPYALLKYVETSHTLWPVYVMCLVLKILFSLSGTYIVNVPVIGHK